MKQIFTLLFIVAFQFLFTPSHAQNVGIGNSTPNPAAILDIQSPNKGVRFPSVTSAQRDAIQNPPDGLHIYNTDEHCLNYYNSLYNTWTCYCADDTCKVVLIRISQSTGNINFNTLYASKFPGATKFTLLIEPGVIVSNGINFTTLSTGIFYTIKIVNRGSIYGVGGVGGRGSSGQVGAPCTVPVQSGFTGGPAIFTLANSVQLIIDNYGILAGGGGGGGGGGRTQLGQYGGGGGGGAGILEGAGGQGGGTTGSVLGSCVSFPVAGFGASGTNSVGGAGGIGASGGSDGGAGGGLGQPGLAGLGFAAGSGGQAGKAVASTNGATGTILNNFGGQVLGVVE